MAFVVVILEHAEKNLGSRMVKLKKRKQKKKKKKKAQEQNENEEKKTINQVNWPLGGSFILSMKFQNKIFLDGALVGVGSVKPMLNWWSQC